MPQYFVDVLNKIASSIDPDELVDRLNLSTEDLCELLADQIAENLNKFDDILEGDDEV